MCLLLRKEIYPYEYVNILERLMEHHYYIKNNFTIAWTWKPLHMLITTMLKEYRKNLK